MIPALHPKLAHVHRLIELSHKLEKVAELYKDDPEIRTKALTVKLGVDNRTFELIKESVNWLSLAKPLAWGAGIGIPVVGGGALAGSHLLDKFYDRSEEATANIRNKVLQTALGLAAIGGGLYGLHRLSGGAPLQSFFSSPQGTPTQETPPKEAAANTLPGDVIEKLATVGVIEDMLGSLPASTPDDATKLATEIFVLNRGYGMNLLYEICHDSND